MRASELRSALKAANLQVSNKILRMIVLRFSNENGELDMEDFLHCCIKLKMMIGIICLDFPTFLLVQEIFYY